MADSPIIPQAAEGDNTDVGAFEFHPLSGPDSDGDGMSNEFEIFYGFNPNDPSDGPLDGDGDGLTNAEEYDAGTDPLSAASALRVVAVAGSGNNFRVTFSLAVTGKSYRLERKNAVTAPMWDPILGLPDFTPMQTGSGEIVDSLGGPDPERFYRIRVLP